MNRQLNRAWSTCTGFVFSIVALCFLAIPIASVLPQLHCRDVPFAAFCPPLVSVYGKRRPGIQTFAALARPGNLHLFVHRLTLRRDRRFQTSRLCMIDQQEQDAQIQQFYNKAASLLAESGGKMDSLQFGRKWRVAYPDDDLDKYRIGKKTVGQLLAACPLFNVQDRKKSSVKTFTLVRPSPASTITPDPPRNPSPSNATKTESQPEAGTTPGTTALGEDWVVERSDSDAVEERQSSRGYKFSVVNVDSSSSWAPNRTEASMSKESSEEDEDDWGQDDEDDVPVPQATSSWKPPTPPQGPSPAANLIDAWSKVGTQAEGGEKAGSMALEMIDAAGAIPDAAPYTRLIQEQARAAAAGDKRALDRSFRVLEEMLKKGIKPTIITYTALISACAKSAGSGHGVYAVDKGMQALQQMQRDGIQPDIVAYNALLDSCAKAASAGDAFGLDRGFRLLRLLRDAGLKPTIVTYNTLMHACAKSSSADSPQAMREAFGLLETMNATGVQPDIVTYNALVDTCARSGSGGLQKAISVLDMMQNSKLTPDIVTFNSLVNACARAAGSKDLSAFSTAMQVLGKMNASGVEANVVTFNSLMTIIARGAAAGDIPDAGAALSQGTQVLAMMLMDGLTPNIITFNALVSAIVKAGVSSGDSCKDELAQVFDLMHQADVQPNSVTFVLVMDCFASEGMGQVQAGLATIELFEEAQLEADGVAYKTIVDGCIRSGSGVRYVMPVLERMATAGCMPQINTFNSLLSLLTKPGEGGCEIGLEMLALMRKADIPLNAATFTILQNIRKADEDAGIEPKGGNLTPFVDDCEEEDENEYIFGREKGSKEWISKETEEEVVIGDVNNTVPWITIREFGSVPPTEDDIIEDFGGGYVDARNPYFRQGRQWARRDIGNSVIGRRQPQDPPGGEDAFHFPGDANWRPEMSTLQEGSEDSDDEEADLNKDGYEP